MQYHGYKSRIEKSKRKLMTIYFAIVVAIGSAFFLTSINFSSFKINRDQVNKMVIGGIPAPIIFDIITDVDTLGIFLWGGGADLRNRLKETGIEEKIKNYYRPYFRDEVELETHIDQIFFDSSGYYNTQEYTVNDQGSLVRKQSENAVQQPQNPQGLFYDMIPNQKGLPSFQQQIPNNGSPNPSKPGGGGLYNRIRPN